MRFVANVERWPDFIWMMSGAVPPAKPVSRMLPYAASSSFLMLISTSGCASM